MEISTGKGRPSARWASNSPRTKGLGSPGRRGRQASSRVWKRGTLSGANTRPAKYWPIISSRR
jgi:hypothetical protein